MRNFVPVDEDLLKIAQDTYNLEVTAGECIHEAALQKALKAALARYEQRVQARIARAAYTQAEAVEGRKDLSPEEIESFSEALTEFGNTLMEELPSLHDSYEPEDGDLVEISLTGEIRLNGEECPNCHHELETADWSILDRYTEAEYWFSDIDFSKAKVRVIKRA